MLVAPTFTEIMEVAKSGGKLSEAPHLFPDAGWSFQDGTGDIAQSVGGRGNNMTLTGAPTWGVGEKGRQLTFDGTTQGGTIPAGLLAGATRFTMAGWVQKNGAPNADIIWEHSVDFNGSTGSFHVRLGGGSIYVQRKTAINYNGGNRADFGTGLHHLVVTWDEVTAGNVCERIFFDGVEQTITNVTHTATTVGLAVPSLPTYVAARAASTNHLACDLTGHAAWSRILSDSEIEELYVDPWAKYRMRQKVFPAAAAGGVPYWVLSSSSYVIGGGVA